MRFVAITAAAAAATMLCVPVGQAAPIFAGSVVGSWGATTAGSDNPTPNVTESNKDANNNGVARLTFGTPDGTPANFFTFDGAGSDPHSAVAAFSNVAAGQLFDLGRFTYYNGTTAIGTAIDAVALGLALSLTSPSDATPPNSNYNYNFTLDITPNVTGNPVLDGDKVTIANGVTSSTFTSGGVSYTLALKGFSTDGGATFTNTFLSPEGSTATADIYAVINQPSLVQVPEPSSIALLGAGLAGVMTLRRRARRT
jgi:hypothetical protein